MGEPDKTDGRTEVIGSSASGREQVGPGRSASNAGGTGAAALAVAALAAGVLACAFSWMFFIRGYVVLAGVVAVLLGLLGVLVARRGGHSATLAVAGAVLGVLSIVAVFATEAVFRSVVQDRLGEVFSDSGDGPGSMDLPSEPAMPSDTAASTSDVPLPGAQPDPAGGTPPPFSGDLAPNNSDAPLAVGQSGEVTGFTVTVTAVITDAAEAIEGAGNLPPTNGRYLLVELSATNTGELTGGVATPGLDVGLAGADGLEYSSIGCYAVLDRPASAVQPLGVGETGSWQACIDASPGALEGSSLFVSQLLASREERVYWQLG